VSLNTYPELVAQLIFPVLVCISINSYIKRYLSPQKKAHLVAIVLVLLVVALAYYSLAVTFNPKIIRGGSKTSIDEVGGVALMGYGLFYGLAFVFPVLGYFIKYRKKIDSRFFLIYIVFLLIIFLSFIKAQFVTAFLSAVIFFFFAFINTSRSKISFFFFVPFLIFISFLLRGYADDVMNYIAGFIPECATDSSTS
jgi:hypothetical protein